MSNPSDRLSLLETFVRIADSGSISAAARDLGISQPAASRQLAKLEDTLQTTLAHRTTHTLTLTENGRRLLQDARGLIDGWAALQDRFVAGHGELTGRLNLVAPVALGQTVLAGIVAGFLGQHPGVQIDWTLTDEPIRFSEVGCDCWVRVGPVPDDTLIVRRIARVERLMVAVPAIADSLPRRRAPRDLDQVGLVALAPFEDARIQLRSDRGKRATLRPAVRSRTNNIVAVKSTVLAGVGMAVLPRWFVEAELASGELVDLLPGWRAAELTVHLAYASDRYQPERLRALLAHVTDALPDAPGILGP